MKKTKGIKTKFFINTLRRGRYDTPLVVSLPPCALWGKELSKKINAGKVGFSPSNIVLNFQYKQLFYKISCDRKEKGEAYKVGKNARCYKEYSTNQNKKSIKKLIGRGSAKADLFLNFANDRQTLTLGKQCPHNSGWNDKHYGMKSSYPAANLYEYG